MDGPLLRKSIDVRTLKQSFDLEDFCWLELGVVCMPAMFDFYYCPKLRVKHCRAFDRKEIDREDPPSRNSFSIDSEKLVLYNSCFRQNELEHHLNY